MGNLTKYRWYAHLTFFIQSRIALKNSVVLANLCIVEVAKNCLFLKIYLFNCINNTSNNLRTTCCMEIKILRRYQQQFGKSMMQKNGFDVLQWMVGLCIDGHICKEVVCYLFQVQHIHL